MSVYKCRIVLNKDEVSEIKILITKFNKIVVESKFFDINIIKMKNSKLESSLIEGAYIYTDEDKDDNIAFITCNNIIEYESVVFNDIAFRFKLPNIYWIKENYAIKKITYRLINNILIATVNSDDVYLINKKWGN